MLSKQVEEATHRAQEAEAMLQQVYETASPFFESCGGYMEAFQVKNMLLNSYTDGTQLVKYLLGLHGDPVRSEIVLKYMSKIKSPSTWVLSVPEEYCPVNMLISSNPLHFIVAFLCGSSQLLLDHMHNALQIGEVTSLSLIGAAAGGHVDTLHSLRERWVWEWLDGAAFLSAAFYGHAPVLTYFANDTPCLPHLCATLGVAAIAAASQNGHFEIAVELEAYMRTTSCNDMVDVPVIQPPFGAIQVV
jgi:hypothetical protein